MGGSAGRVNWGPVRVLAGRLERDGYRVTEVRSPQYILLALTGSPVNCGTELSLLAEGRLALKPPERVTTGLQEQPYSTLPVLPALAPLLPGGGVAKGSVVAVEQPGALCLALMAGASQAGMWCGVAGLPDLGVLAAAGAGVEPGRMMLVPEPGPQWAEVAATMLDACEVVLMRPAGRAPAQARRRLETAARRSGAALIVAGTWDGAPVRLYVARQQWGGIGDGYGRLRARRAEVVAECQGRGRPAAAGVAVAAGPGRQGHRRGQARRQPHRGTEGSAWPAPDGSAIRTCP